MRLLSQDATPPEAAASDPKLQNAGLGHGERTRRGCKNPQKPTSRRHAGKIFLTPKKQSSLGVGCGHRLETRREAIFQTRTNYCIAHSGAADRSGNLSAWRQPTFRMDPNGMLAHDRIAMLLGDTSW